MNKKPFCLLMFFPDQRRKASNPSLKIEFRCFQAVQYNESGEISVKRARTEDEYFDEDDDEEKQQQLKASEAELDMPYQPAPG